MRVIESDYPGVPIGTYLEQLMQESSPSDTVIDGPCITGEDLANVLECTVDELYELLQGTRDITTKDIEALEARYAEASSLFVVGCQMMSVLSHIGHGDNM